MKNFDEIIANLEAELSELKEINNSLKKENVLLREKLGMTKSEKPYKTPDIITAFDTKKIRLDANPTLLLNTRNCMLRSGYNTFSDFNDAIAPFFRKRDVGPHIMACTIVILQHYDIEVSDYITPKNKELVEDYRKKIVFTE